MNAILGFSQLMEYDDTLPGEHQDSVQEILKAGHHLLELINEVLDLAKVESGHIDLSLEPVEVCLIVEECLGLVSTLADQRDIQLSLPRLQGGGGAGRPHAAQAGAAQPAFQCHQIQPRGRQREDRVHPEGGPAAHPGHRQLARASRCALTGIVQALQPPRCR